MRIAWLSNIAYPKVRVPNSASLAPYPVPSAVYTYGPTDVQVAPLMDATAGGYVIVLCNTSNYTRRIQGITVTIASASPFSDTLRIWDPCTSEYDAASHQVRGGGCGGADIENDYMRATFAASAGTSATTTARMVEVRPSLQPVLGPLPVTLAPNMGLAVEVGIAGISGPATYVFSFAIAVDGAAPVKVATSQPTLLAPPSQRWSGEGCLSAAMQAKMPSSGTFVCPPAS